MNTPKIHLFSPAVGSVLGALNSGLTTPGIGSVGVHASSKGMRITLNGRTMAKGKTPEELHENFRAEVAKAVAGKKD